MAMVRPGRFMSMKSSNDTIGNRTRDIPACRTVPQPTALMRAPYVFVVSRMPGFNNLKTNINLEYVNDISLSVTCKSQDHLPGSLGLKLWSSRNTVLPTVSNWLPINRVSVAVVPGYMNLTTQTRKWKCIFCP